MFQKKSISELLEIMNDLKTHLTQFDENTGRDASSDMSLLDSNHFRLIMSSDIDLIDKKKIILSQIGIIRINLSSAYDYKIIEYENNVQLNDAINLMNQYVNKVAIPFIGEISGPSIIDHIKDFLSIRRLKTTKEYIQEWQSHHASWPNIDWSNPINQLDKDKIYNEMKIIYNMLYALSFSNNNFPSMPNIVLVDNKLRV